MLLKRHKKRIVKAVGELVRTIVPDAKAGGATPKSKYPTTALEVGYRYCLTIPEGVSDLIADDVEGATLKRLMPYITDYDRSIGNLFREHGLGRMGEYWGGATLCQMLWPYGDDPEYDAKCLKHGRWATDEERAAWEAKYGQPMFTDEAWIPVRYAGINVFRTVEVPADSPLARTVIESMIEYSI